MKKTLLSIGVLLFAAAAVRDARGQVPAPDPVRAIDALTASAAGGQPATPAPSVPDPKPVDAPSVVVSMKEMQDAYNKMGTTKLSKLEGTWQKVLKGIAYEKSTADPAKGTLIIKQVVNPVDGSKMTGVSYDGDNEFYKVSVGVNVGGESSPVLFSWESPREVPSINMAGEYCRVNKPVDLMICRNSIPERKATGICHGLGTHHMWCEDDRDPPHPAGYIYTLYRRSTNNEGRDETPSRSDLGSYPHSRY